MDVGATEPDPEEKGHLGEIRKFAFVGGVCTGKTTLLEACRIYLGGDPSVAFVEECARRFFNRNPKLEHLTTATQLQLVDMIIAEETRAASRKGVRLMFCDRAVTDAVPYAEVSGDSTGATLLSQRIADWVPTYDFFVLDPADVLYARAGVRTETSLARDQIHQACIRYLTRSRLPFDILRGPLANRLATVLRVVGRY